VNELTDILNSSSRTLAKLTVADEMLVESAIRLALRNAREHLHACEGSPKCSESGLARARDRVSLWDALAEKIAAGEVN